MGWKWLRVSSQILSNDQALVSPFLSLAAVVAAAAGREACVPSSEIVTDRAHHSTSPDVAVHPNTFDSSGVHVGWSPIVGTTHLYCEM